MVQVSHTRRAKPRTTRAPASRAPPPTVREALQAGARRLDRARLFYGHGTDNAVDDAAVLLWHAMQFDYAVPAERAYRRRMTAAQLATYEDLLAQRIARREPAVYLTGRTLFAGLPMRIDRRALVPRSPIAELVEHGFEEAAAVGVGGGEFHVELVAKGQEFIDLGDDALLFG